MKKTFRLVLIGALLTSIGCGGEKPNRAGKPELPPRPTPEEVAKKNADILNANKGDASNAAADKQKGPPLPGGRFRPPPPGN